MSNCIALHKKGSSKDCGNHRTIALISHANKILLHVINRRLNYFLSRQITEEQAGSVKGKGTREQPYGQQWDKLWNVLLKIGAPEHLVGLMQALYSKILYPALLNIHGEYIIRKIIEEEDWEKGFAISGKRRSNVRYADDTVLVATSIEEMRDLFQRLELESTNIY